MIGRGGIFAELRTQMLAAIPENASAVYGQETTMGDWISRGTYFATTCSRSGARLEASHADIASTLLGEAENLTNHCFEHLQELLCFAEDSRPRSDAWATVTGYYLGFFSASALLRILGRPIVFLNREQLNCVQQITGTGQQPNQGAFEVKIATPISFTHREVLLQKSEKVHEATWKTLLQMLD